VVGGRWSLASTTIDDLDKDQRQTTNGKHFPTRNRHPGEAAGKRRSGRGNSDSWRQRILPGHAPLITELAVGVITYRAGGESNTLAVAWGFAEVLSDKVTILAETAERPQDIDTARAQKAKERAEQRLKSNDTEVDYTRAEDALQRAETRLKVAAEK
jgi:F-type H+-transporting ATPase subunit epsilon